MKKKQEIDWFKKLSPRVKAEILGGVLHQLMETYARTGSKRVKVKINKKDRQQAYKALFDCSILADDLTTLDYKHLRSYFKDLEGR